MSKPNHKPTGVPEATSHAIDVTRASQAAADESPAVSPMGGDGKRSKEPVWDDYDDFREAIFADLETRVNHDPGCMYTPNGDGWPESTDGEVVPDERAYYITPALADNFTVGEKLFDSLKLNYYNGKGADPEDEVDVIAEVIALDKSYAGDWMFINIRYDLNV